MQIERTVLLDADPAEMMVGDVISFTLEDGEQVKAMKMADDGTFLFVDCLKEEQTMKELDLGKILRRIPDEIVAMMEPWPDGQFLRLPTEKEIFGTNKIGEDEPEEVVQWEPMKERRNRIAFQGLNGPWEWYWLSNKKKGSAAFFAAVASGGLCDCNNASDASGVRPAFRF